MGRVTGEIVSWELHPSGPWARVHLSGGEKIYMHEGMHLAGLAETYGTLTPPLPFEFDISFLMRQVKSFRPGRGATLDDPERSRQTHTQFGARLGKDEHATLVAGAHASGGCVQPMADPNHGAKNCVLKAGHGSSHLGRCLACYRVVLLESQA